MLHTQQKEYLEVLVLVERAVLFVLVIDVVVL